jgi:hypothetical protein
MLCEVTNKLPEMVDLHVGGLIQGKFAEPQFAESVIKISDRE